MPPNSSIERTEPPLRARSAAHLRNVMRQGQNQWRASNFSESEANAPQVLLDVQETMRTKRFSRLDADELRREYDLAALGPGVRGRYFERASASTNVVRLGPDVATAFPTSESVNMALRVLVDVAEAAARGGKGPAGRKR